MIRQLKIGLSLALFAAFSLTGGEIAGTWYADSGAGKQAVPEAKAAFRFPGSLQIFKEPDHRTFRPQKEQFDTANLALDVRLSGTDKSIPAVLFFKNKEGHWFQSIEIFEITPGEWQTLQLPLDRRGEYWRPVGHYGGFDALAAAELFIAGVSVYSDDAVEGTLECRNLRRDGERRKVPLGILDWELPATGEVNALVEGKFQLTRDYFNPFDPDEIAVDFELKHPDGSVRKYPAFYTRDYRRERHFTRETNVPLGESYWAMRFTPTEPGDYAVRLLVRDSAEEKILESSWKNFTASTSAPIMNDATTQQPADSSGKPPAAGSSLPGLIRVSKTHPAFFERTDGSFFFPVGLNIHTNTDRRSEMGFQFGHLPDRGTFDYDEYLNSCGNSGINAVEIWMASWTMALENDAARAGSYGVGRYNLEAAARLDHVMECARNNGIYVNLIIDNHGRITNGSDPEWTSNPINARSVNAVANGGFLQEAWQFFGSQEAEKNNSKRARYIAARWGSMPNLMAIELWSEVNLTERFPQLYQEGVVPAWTERAAAEMSSMCRPDTPISTHISNDYAQLLRYKDLFTQKSITHLAGDAYRDTRVHFVDHLRAYEAAMRLGKPQLITEYGGNPHGSSRAEILADVHSGLWGSLFTRLSGTPFLWWHDFIHIGNHYQHYRGFANYLAGIDLRSELQYVSPQLKLPEGAPRYEGLAVAKPDAAYGWIFHRDAMKQYPDAPENFAATSGILATLPAKIADGEYNLQWFDTLTGELFQNDTLHVTGGTIPEIKVPQVRTDVAFKLEKGARQ